MLRSFEPSEVFPAHTLVYHRKDNYNNLIFEKILLCQSNDEDLQVEVTGKSLHIQEKELVRMKDVKSL